MEKSESYWSKEGDAVAAGAKAALASRTNTLLPMLYFMVSSALEKCCISKSYLLIDGYLSTGFWIVFVAVLLIELNAIFGKMFPVITSVKA